LTGHVWLGKVPNQGRLCSALRRGWVSGLSALRWQI
jgi:hypothetical protein